MDEALGVCFIPTGGSFKVMRTVTALRFGLHEAGEGRPPTSFHCVLSASVPANVSHIARRIVNALGHYIICQAGKIGEIRVVKISFFMTRV